MFRTRYRGNIVSRLTSSILLFVYVLTQEIFLYAGNIVDLTVLRAVVLVCVLCGTLWLLNAGLFFYVLSSSLSNCCV